jgi:hypothetical protein
MGNKGSKAGKTSKLPDKPVKLTSKDLSFLSESTGLPKQQIEDVFNKFSANNPG